MDKSTAFGAAIILAICFSALGALGAGEKGAERVDDGCGENAVVTGHRISNSGERQLTCIDEEGVAYNVRD